MFHARWPRVLVASLVMASIIVPVMPIAVTAPAARSATIPAQAQVREVTDPRGKEAGWTFTLDGPGGPVSRITSGTGYHVFPLALVEGSYVITQAPRAEWDSYGSRGDCEFSVQYPRDAGRIFSCTYTNIEPGRIFVQKIKDPAEVGAVFTYATTGSGYAGFTLTGNEEAAHDSGPLRPGLYSVTEESQPGWTLDQVNCVGASHLTVAGATASITLEPGETVECVFSNTNTQARIIVREYASDPTDQEFQFQTSGAGYAPFAIKGTGVSDSGALSSGTYTVHEVVPAGWELAPASCVGDSGEEQNLDDATVQVELQPGEVVYCDFHNSAHGLLGVTKRVAFEPPSPGQSFTFQLRQGATTTSVGTILATKNADETNVGEISFGPVQTGTYQLCETVMPHWLSSVGRNQFEPPDGVPANPDVDNTIVCADVSVDGQFGAFPVFVNNTPPPAGSGALTITKLFDPDTSGFTGTFTINYFCDRLHNGDIALARGGSATITGIPAGTECRVREPTPLSPAYGWRFGSPILSDDQAAPFDGIVTIAANATARVTVTNTIRRTLGSLQISKFFDPAGSGFAGSFTVHYACDATHSGDVTLPATGGWQTITGIAAGTRCTVSEPTLPSPPFGWSFGTPIISRPLGIGLTALVDIVADVTTNVLVLNRISRDGGSLQIRKIFDPLTSGFSGTFDINYDCDDGTVHDGTAHLRAGNSTTITGFDLSGLQGHMADFQRYITTYEAIPPDLRTSRQNDALAVDLATFERHQARLTQLLPLASGIPVGTQCTVNEPTRPTPPTGWTFGIPALSDGQTPTDDGVVSIATKGTTYAVSVTNTISQGGTGSLRITKAFDPGTSGFTGSFAAHFVCDAAHVGNVNLANGGSQTISGIPVGTQCTVSEPSLPAPPPGWGFGVPALLDNQAPTTDGKVTITTAATAYTVAVTNTISRDTGSLKITKTVTGVLPAGYTNTFSVDVVCTGDGGAYNNQIISYPTPGFVTISDMPTGNTCTVTEDTPSGAPTGYSWGTAVISGSPATITKGGTAEVTVANTLTGRAKVIKTKDGSPPSGTQSFIFQLRSGASTTDVGTILETGTANAGNAGVINFSTALIASNHYQVCELVMPGWNTNLSGTLFVPGSIIPPTLPNPNVDNSPVCVDFIAQAGVTTTFTVENSFPGGLARTIGFWKNWASCANSNGKGQKPILDQTLALAGSGGLVVSADGGTFPSFSPTIWLTLKGSTATPNAATDCLKAVNLLNKSTMDGKKKMASDPAFNLAAQLIAAELNFYAGTAKNGTAITAVNQAVVILGKYHFTGNGYTGKISAADATTMNNLARTLDNYNNNRS